MPNERYENMDEASHWKAEVQKSEIPLPLWSMKTMELQQRGHQDL
jgi:hypothetical protein